MDNSILQSNYIDYHLNYYYFQPFSINKKTLLNDYILYPLLFLINIIFNMNQNDNESIFLFIFNF